MARDGMLAGSSCLKIANALFIQYRRWTQDVPGIFQYYVFLFQYFNSKNLSATVLSKMFFFYSLFLLVEY